MPMIKPREPIDDAQFITLQGWVWVCIYGGLLLAVISHFMRPLDVNLADWSLYLGLLLVALGCILLYVRSVLGRKEE